MSSASRQKQTLIDRGSLTARDGFANEHAVIAQFNNWNRDPVAQAWLVAMGYRIEQIESVVASKVRGQYKADIQVRVHVLGTSKKQEDIQNLQIKLVSNPQGFNQIDKRWVDTYVELWNIPQDIKNLLQLYTGEATSSVASLRDPRRMFITEMEPRDQEKLVQFFTDNKSLIVSDILKGRGELSADWMLVILHVDGKTSWVLRSIAEVIHVFGAGEVRITKDGNLKIGAVGMQRKGGDNGRETAKMLQFKINPVQLFQ